MAFTPKVKRLVTVPQIKMEIEHEYYFRMETAITVSKVKPQKGEEPAMVVTVTNLERGEPRILIVNAALASILTEEYPEAEYVGLCFAITKHDKADGKKYHTFDIAEIEDPAE